MANKIATITSYYQAMSKKNISEMEKYLHPDVLFITPLTTVHGKENLVHTIKQFLNFFKTLTIRTAMESQNQAMLAYDVNFPEPIGICRSVAIMDFKDGFIFQIELFYDARPFEKK